MYMKHEFWFGRFVEVKLQPPVNTLKVKRAVRQKVEILNDLLIKTGKLE